MNLSKTLYNPSDHRWQNQRTIRSISLPNIANKKYLNVTLSLILYLGDKRNCEGSFAFKTTKLDT